MGTLEIYLIPVVKDLEDFLFLLMIMLMKSHLILTKICFLPRIKIKNYSIEIDGIYDQAINDIIKQYNKVRKYQQDKVKITQLIVY